MKDKIYLFLYLVFIIILTLVHNLWFLSILCLGFILISIKKSPVLIKKSITSVILFNGVITIAYIIYAQIYGKDWVYYVSLLNIRVFALTYLTFLFVEYANLFKAFSFSKTLLYLLTLSYTQILIVRRQFIEFKHALTSRIITRPERKQMYNFIHSVFYFFLSKTMKNTKDISDAMKSRGFFID